MLVICFLALKNSLTIFVKLILISKSGFVKCLAFFTLINAQDNFKVENLVLKQQINIFKILFKVTCFKNTFTLFIKYLYLNTLKSFILF